MVRLSQILYFLFDISFLHFTCTSFFYFLQTLNLPVERGDSQSSSESSGAKYSSTQQCDLTITGHPRINYLSRHSIDSTAKGSGPECPPRVKEPPPGGGGTVGGSADNYSYVQLTAVHEYIYPSIEDRRDSLKKSSLETPLTSTSSVQPALPSKKKDKRKNCRHCQVSCVGVLFFWMFISCGLFLL